MQTAVEIQDQIREAENHIRKVKTALDASENYQATLAYQRELTDANGALELLQARLSEARQREEEDRTERTMIEAKQKLVDSEAEHADCLEGEAFAIEELARRIEDAAEQTAPLVNRAAQLRSEHPYLLEKATGAWPDEVLTALPKSAPPTPRSRFYEVAALAVIIARDTETGGPYSLDLVLAHIDTGTLTGVLAARRTLESARFQPGPVIETNRGISPGQRIARMRREPR